MRRSFARPTSPPLTLLTLGAAARAELARRSAQKETAARRSHESGDLDASRERCKTLVGFIREAWHVLEPMTPYVHGWHIDAISEHLEGVTHGQLRHVKFNIPPGGMKSLLVSVFWTAWEWGPGAMPWTRWLTAAFEQDMALRDNDKLRKLIESDWYQARWPMALPRRGEKKFSNEFGGSRWARAFMSMTGGRGDRVVVDDPHSTKTAESDTQRQSTVRQFREGITDRFNDPRTSALIVMMQRLHEQDVSGIIEELGLEFTSVVIPMEFEVKRRCITRLPGTGALFWQDPRSTEGELMCPERWDRPTVEALKKAKGSYAYEGQYQQRPVPREGGLFKRAWFDGKFIDTCPPLLFEVRHWDLAATNLAASDTKGARTAGVRMGLAADGSIVVLHCVAQGTDSPDKLITSTAEADGKGVEISLPQDPGQAGKVQKKGLISRLKGYIARGRPETGDKVTRALPYSVQCEAGNVYLLRGAWNQEYLDEICNFPGGARKDIADASSGAFARLLDHMATGANENAGAEVHEHGGEEPGDLVEPAHDIEADQWA